MPRRKGKVQKRTIAPDSRYSSELVQRFINVVMERGKKNAARAIMYEALDILTKKAGGNKDKTLALLNKAFDQVRPVVEVRSRRVGGSVYQVPVEVRQDRSRALAIRWIIAAARGRGDKTMGKRLGHEFLDASEGRGAAVKKKIDVHKMAEANRAFSHYAW